jgi:septum formation protein
MNERGPLGRIVLASASPRRFELLRSLGLHVDVLVSGYQEPPAPHLTPPELASLHAREKLAAALSGIVGAHAPVVAADTVVDLDATPLGKPRDAVEAATMLRALAGREHRVHTGFALAPSRDAPWIEERSTTRVTFYPLTEEEIAEYVATGDPLDKAGAYGIQGLGAALIKSIDGDFFTVMGFPLGRFVRALRRSGFSLRTAKRTTPS